MHKSNSTKAATRAKSNIPSRSRNDESDSVSNSVKSELPPPTSHDSKAENVRVGIRIRPMNEL